MWVCQCLRSTAGIKGHAGNEAVSLAHFTAPPFTLEINQDGRRRKICIVASPTVPLLGLPASLHIFQSSTIQLQGCHNVSNADPDFISTGLLLGSLQVTSALSGFNFCSALYEGKWGNRRRTSKIARKLFEMSGRFSNILNCIHPTTNRKVLQPSLKCLSKHRTITLTCPWCPGANNRVHENPVCRVVQSELIG